MSDTALIPDDPNKQERILHEMEEQRNVQAIHEQRITQVEQKITQVDTRVSIVEVKQSRYEVALEKLADIMAIQATKTTLTESAIDTLKDGQAQHHKTMEEMKREQVDTGKVLVKLESTSGFSVGAWKTLGVALAGAVVTVIVTHFLHF